MCGRAPYTEGCGILTAGFVVLPAEQEGKQASSAHFPRTPSHCTLCGACPSNNSAVPALFMAVRGGHSHRGVQCKALNHQHLQICRVGRCQAPLTAAKSAVRQHTMEEVLHQSRAAHGLSAGSTTLAHLATCAKVAMIHTPAQCRLSNTRQHSRHANNCAGPQKPDTAKTQRLRPLLGVSQPLMHT